MNAIPVENAWLHRSSRNSVLLIWFRLVFQGCAEVIDFAFVPWPVDP